MCFISGTKAFIKKKLEKSNIIRKIATNNIALSKKENLGEKFIHMYLYYTPIFI